MLTKGLSKTSKDTKELIIIISCFVIGIGSFVFLVNYFATQDEINIQKSQDEFILKFTINGIYHGFNGDYLAQARQLPDLLHSDTHTYDWIIWIKGSEHYFQTGEKPIVPTKEQLCKAGLSEAQNCLDLIIVEKLK